MPTQEEKKTLNIFDAKVFDDFTKLVEDKGYTQYRAAEGALRAFIALPSEAQVALMSNVEPSQNPEEVFRKMVLDIVDQKMNGFYAADLEQEATLEEIEHEESPAKLRNLLRNERKRTKMLERKLSDQEEREKALRKTVARQKKERLRLKATRRGPPAKP